MFLRLLADPAGGLGKFHGMPWVTVFPGYFSLSLIWIRYCRCMDVSVISLWEWWGGEGYPARYRPCLVIITSLHQLFSLRNTQCITPFRLKHYLHSLNANMQTPRRIFVRLFLNGWALPVNMNIALNFLEKKSSSGMRGLAMASVQCKQV